MVFAVVNIKYLNEFKFSLYLLGQSILFITNLLKNPWSDDKNSSILLNESFSSSLWIRKGFQMLPRRTFLDTNQNKRCHLKGHKSYADLTVKIGSSHLSGQNNFKVPKNEIFHSKIWVLGTWILFDRIVDLAHNV